MAWHKKPNNDTEPRVQRLVVGSYTERCMGLKSPAGAGLCAIHGFDSIKIGGMKENIKTILIIVLFLFLFAFVYLFSKSKSAGDIISRPEGFFIKRAFHVSELYFPEGEREGRLSRRQCYLAVPCYETGGRISSVTCEDSSVASSDMGRLRDYFWDF